MIKLRTFLTSLALLAFAEAGPIRPEGGPLNRSRIKSVGSQFSPDSITGLKLWLKADALVLSDADPVGTWTDSSGLGNDATQATAGKKPIYKVNIVNGKPVVRFDAVDDGMAAALSLVRPYTLFLVEKGLGAGSTRTLNASTNSLINANRGGGNNVFLAAAVVSLRYGTDNVALVSALSVSAAATTTFHHNGTNIATSTPSANWGTVALGADGGGAGAAEPANADVCEVLAYDTFLSDTNRRLVEAYLGAKYGITVQ